MIFSVAILCCSQPARYMRHFCVGIIEAKTMCVEQRESRARRRTKRRKQAREELLVERYRSGKRQLNPYLCAIGAGDELF